MNKKKKLTKKQLRFYKKLITEKIKDVQKGIKSLEQLSSEESNELKHISQYAGDLASINIDIEKSFQLAGREGTFLKNLENALFKIEEETFGQCTECSELISEVRLKAVPIAKMCFECKTQKEKLSH